MAKDAERRSAPQEPVEDDQPERPQLVFRALVVLLVKVAFLAVDDGRCQCWRPSWKLRMPLTSWRHPSSSA